MTGTLTGHAIGAEPIPALDHAAVALAIGGAPASQPARPVDLPEPLASVVDYLGDDLDTRDFVPTAELVDALGVEPTLFGRQMGELGCRPGRDRITTDTGTSQVRGYFTADLRTALRTHQHDH